MRIRVRIDPDCEHTLNGLAACWQGAAFLAVSGLVVAGFVLLLSYAR